MSSLNPKEKLRILVLAPQPFYQNRGTPIAVRLLVTELARLGHEVDLLVYHEGDDLAIQGVTLHRIPAPPWVKNVPPSITWKKLVCDGVMFFKAMGLMRKKQYSVVHAVEEAAFLALVLRFLFRVDYIYDMDSSLAMQVVEKLTFLRPLQPLFSFFEKAAVRNSCGVVAVCQALVDIAVGYAPDKRIVRLEDISLLEDSQETGESLRERYGIVGPIMLYVGNLEGYQGIDLLLDGFQLALEGGAEGNVVIIGGSPESISFYRDKARSLGIGERTFFCGPRPVDQLGAYLAQADILLSPRIQGNNTPMKLYSYLDAGKAVLATRLATHTQVLNDACSCLVEPNSESMGAGIVRLLADPGLCAGLGQMGRKIARENYSLAAFQRKLSGFYAAIATDFQRKGRAGSRG